MNILHAAARHFRSWWFAYLGPAAVLAFIASQFFIYYPFCSGSWERSQQRLPWWAVRELHSIKVHGSLSDEFADAVTAEFRERDLGYLRVGNIIFLANAYPPDDWMGDERVFVSSYIALAKVAAPVLSNTWLTMPDDIRVRLEERGSTPPGCDAATLGNPLRDPSAWEIKRCEEIAVFRRVDDDCELVRALAVKDWGR